MKSAFATALLATVSAFAAHAAPAPDLFECQAQVVRADGSTDIQPESVSGGNVRMTAAQNGRLGGSVRIPFAGAHAYDVDLALSVELDRSRWVEGAPRLTVALRARDAADGRLIAMHADHSDKILSPFMVESLRNAGPRVVYQVHVPEQQARLEAIQDAAVIAARASSVELGFYVAAQRGLLPAHEAYRFDVVCVTNQR